jgi:hypothetical protein
MAGRAAAEPGALNPSRRAANPLHAASTMTAIEEIFNSRHAVFSGGVFVVCWIEGFFT